MFTYIILGSGIPSFTVVDGMEWNSLTFTPKSPTTYNDDFIQRSPRGKLMCGRLHTISFKETTTYMLQMKTPQSLFQFMIYISRVPPSPQE
jgi:hypothetical protein